MEDKRKETDMKRLMMMLMLMMIGLPCFAQPDLATRLKTQMEYLTSPEVAGRDAPGPNGDKVAQWVADRFKEDGIEKGGSHHRSDFFDKVTIMSSKIAPEYTFVTIYADLAPRGMRERDTMKHTPDYYMRKTDLEKRLRGVTHTFKYGDDLLTFPRRLSYFNQMELKGVPCGYGLSLPELNRNDYPEAVKGCVAFVKPGQDLPPDKTGMRGGTAFKAAAAERAGAIAMFICYPDTAVWPPVEVQSKLADSSKVILDVWKSKVDPSPEFHVYYLRLPKGTGLEVFEGKLLRFRTGFETPIEQLSNNVVGLLPGSTHEWVIVGAHYDHIGEGFPGADDNASGTVGLLELARKWGRSGEVPKRGIIFVSFTCEEDGLLGSQWFAQHLPVPKDKVVAMINLDMIGRDGFANFREAMKPGATPPKGYAAAYFSAPSPALKDILRSAADGVDLQTTVQPINSFRHFGDGAPFHEAGIPTVHIFSGFHADYHQPTDTPDKIDYDKIAKMIELTDRTLKGLVEAPTRPGFDPTIKSEGGGMGY